MKIMGIDPGYGITGYGIIKKKGVDIKAISHGVIQTPPSESIPVRLAMLYEQLDKLIKEHQPDEIAIEELFFNTNITTGIKVAEARGVILLCAINNCGMIYEYTPLQVKMALTGSGKAEKKQVQYMIKAILRLNSDVKPDDAADALAIAVCHANTAIHGHRILN